MFERLRLFSLWLVLLLLLPPLPSTAFSVSSKQTKLPGTANLDVAWEDLGFEFRPVHAHVELVYKDHAWSQPVLKESPYIQLHIGATALHYGQACFEGLKAFCHQDKSVHIFRPDQNAQRLSSSCQRLMMAELPAETFVQALEEAVRANLEFVPPYGSNGALYIRPLLFGSGPRIGLQPADEYTFLVMVLPVGDYYKGGLSAPVAAKVILDFDRAAPRGVGHVKVAGNYAADLLPNFQCKKEDFPIGLYLDAQSQTFVEEFSTSNFVGIKGNTYVTPKSKSVLPSITNKSLMDVARSLGMEVEEREVPVSELDSFDEILAVGTAVVVTPVGSISLKDQTFEYGSKIGATTQKLYDKIRAIQNGEIEDEFGWNHVVEY